MANLNRGRVSVRLFNAAQTLPGYHILGEVTRKGEMCTLGVDQSGEYWALALGQRPELLPRIKVQSAIAAIKTGMGQK